MATKTITIDMEAYGRLKTVQHENESFSQTIKRVIPKPISTKDLITLFRNAGSELGDGFFRGVEAALEARSKRVKDTASAGKQVTASVNQEPRSSRDNPGTYF